MSVPRRTYAEAAVPEVRRLLTLLDRNPHSPTYGCFHRDYWLYKTSDFPDAVRQFGVHSLALVYSRDFPGNAYRGNPLVREWALAGLRYWARIQHKDGSFDEFYPYERGWVGPTAFTCYTAAEALLLLAEEAGERDREIVSSAVRKAAYFISGGESEKDYLANHHAMAALALWKAFELLREERIKKSYEKALETFASYHDAEEGWSREYDGADPGYLSATVSFLGKIYKANSDPEIFKIMKESVNFCSYFIYPDGSYAGPLGSRNTQHFYPHGFEIAAAKLPEAASAAEACLKALSQEKLVPPSIMSDRYVFYRVPELLLSYLDYSERPDSLPPLPCEKEGEAKEFPRAGIAAAARNEKYTVANLKKGGVVKVFDTGGQKAILNDCGIIGALEDGRTVTSQWIDEAFEIKTGKDGWEVSGYLNEAPSQKLMSLAKNIIFRLVLFAGGRSPRFSHMLKGKIRSMLILGGKKVPVSFRRVFREDAETARITSEIRIEGAKTRFKSLSAGGEFFVRYVPQSRFFQFHELSAPPREFTESELERLNSEKSTRITLAVSKLKEPAWTVE